MQRGARRGRSNGGDAGAGADFVGLPLPVETRAGDGLDDLLRGHLRAGERAVGEENGELVAADSRGEILGAAAAPDGVPDLLQQRSRPPRGRRCR